MEYSLCTQALRIVCSSGSRKARVAGTLETLFSLPPVNPSDPSGMELLIHDVPPGSRIVYGDPRSFASHTLAFPAGADIALRYSYFGASFTYTAGTNLVAGSGHDREVATGTRVKLDGSDSFSLSGNPLSPVWKLISIPGGSAAVLSEAHSATPEFSADREGVYLAQLIVDDGSTHSTPSTVSITAVPR